MSEQIALASPPQRGNMKSVYQAIQRNGAMSRPEIKLATGLGQKQLDSALSNMVYRGHLERNSHSGLYAVAPAVVQEACSKVRNESRKSTGTGKAVTVTLAPHIVARIDAEVEKRRLAGKKATRSEVMRLAVLAYKRPRSSKPQEVVIRVDLKPWWRFWK